MSLIIGFSGRARHGKTEACHTIVREVQKFADYSEMCVTGQRAPVKMYDIGDMIRRYCIASGRLPNIPRSEFNREQLEILINVGREKRAVDVNYWIGQMMDAVALENPLVALCPNLRYLNEAVAVRNAGGYVVRMVRLNKNGSVYISPDRPANDISETELEFWSADFTITNKEGHADLTNDYVSALFHYLWRK